MVKQLDGHGYFGGFTMFTMVLPCLKQVDGLVQHSLRCLILFTSGYAR